MKRILTGFIIALGLAATVSAQGTLSNQVLRLLTRANYWSGVQMFAHTVGATLERGAAPSITTDTLYNVGGNLYFNGILVATSTGMGTVTSVDLTMPAIFSVSGNPVTSSGTLAVALANETANRVFAGPTTGSAATPTFRALVAADIPDISATYLTPAGAAALTNKTGNISQWTNDSNYLTSTTTGSSTITTLGTIVTGTWNASVIAGLYGGTGVANSGKTITLGGNITTADAFVTSGANSLTLTTTGATNVTLPTTGTLVNSAVTTLSSLVSIGTVTTGTWSATTIAVNKGGTGFTSYAVGDLLYASGAAALSKLADVATGNALISGGVGVAPSWGKIALASAVSGTLPVANGGTNLTTASDDQTMVSNGTTWQAKTLPDCQTGTFSYTQSSNAFSCSTSVLIGTGAPTPSANNILLRSTVNTLFEVMAGNAGALGDMMAGRVAFGDAGDESFASTYANIANTYTGAGISSTLEGFTSTFSPSPSTASTASFYANDLELVTGGTHNFVDVYGLYAGSFNGTSGTVTTNIGNAFIAEQDGSNTITTNIAAQILSGNTAAGTITNNRGISIDTPYNSGGGTLTNHYGMYIDNQTLAGTTIDYAFFYNAPSSKEFIIKSDGQTLIKALKTTGSATGKNVVCVDTATGQLYASSTGTDCSN